jgi:hypothetical protein
MPQEQITAAQLKLFDQLWADLVQLHTAPRIDQYPEWTENRLQERRDEVVRHVESLSEAEALSYLDAQVEKRRKAVEAAKRKQAALIELRRLMEENPDCKTWPELKRKLMA